MKTKYLKGSKGGGGGGGNPVQTPDNLRSKDTVEVVLALSEGPIKGLKDGKKSFNVGDTPLQNQSGELNFTTFVLNLFPGTDAPDPVVPILGGQGSNSPVNVPLATNTPLVRQTSLQNIDYIDIRLAFTRLFKSDNTGTYNHSAVFRIEYKQSSLSTWNKVFNQDITLTGKTTSTYVKEFRIAVPNVADTYDLRITKLSPANTESLFSDFSWESFQETIATPRSYPNTAVIQVCGEASDQFSSIPTWSGIYEGLIIKVPTNYDPVARTYTGAWDGSWQLAYTNNPAWCLYDFVMNDRYGIKSYYTEINLDKYDVYDAAQWCDGMVPDGQGGMQPRYTFNSLISEPRSGKELARYIAGVFNATFYDDLNGKAYLRVDKDDDSQHVFMKENVTEAGFEYGYTDITTRYNDVTVSFNNPDLDWQEDRRRIYNQASIDKFGRIPLDFIAVGCTNEHEALRRAQYKMITSLTENCIVNFTTNRLGSIVNPFDVILICDPDMGYGISGRVKSFSGDRTVCTLRDPIYLEVGVNYYASFTLNDGSQFKAPLIDVLPGYNMQLTFQDSLPSNMPEKATFALEAEGYIGLPRPFRVTKVEEGDGSIDSFNIEAININRNKFYDSDNLTDSGVIDYSTLPNPMNPPGPVSCGFDERFIKERLEFQIVVSPFFNRGAYKYYSNDHSFEVWSRPAGTTEPFVKREVMFNDTLINHPPGNYEFKILGKSYLGFTTQIDSASSFFFNVTNPKDPPADIDWLRINKLEAYWGYENPPDDFAGFILRYHNREGRTTWNDAQQPHTGLLTVSSFYTQLIPPSARVIMVRAVDAFGIPSVNSAIIYRPLGDVSVENEEDRTDFHPTWAGTKVGCSVDSGQLVADDNGALMYSGTPTALMYDGGDFYGSTFQEMTYEDSFTTTVSGALVIEIDFLGSGYEVLIKESTETVYQTLPARLQLEPGTYDIFLRVFGGPQQGIVNSFSTVIDADVIEEDIQDVTISSGGTRIPLTKEYGTIRLVSVIIQDDSGSRTAVGYTVIDKDPDLGPLIKLIDASGAYVGGLVDVYIKGHA